MRSSLLLALAASLSSTQAVWQGFNYGNLNTDFSIKTQTDFENEFKTAQNLVGTSGFTSARLYTMIQGGTTNTPISAIQAAINTRTSLLLGVWCSGGRDFFNNELVALRAAVAQYGTAFTSLVTGLSVGSEDLYRISPTGLAAPDAAPGAGPDLLVQYISDVKAALEGTALAGVRIGHVDTWTAWVNGSNSAVINAVDWLGTDAYPYFQSTQDNRIENNARLFLEAYDATVAVSGGKEVWVTETGFPVSGKTLGQAVPSPENARTYWQQVGCDRLFGKVNTYWYTLQDTYPVTPNPSFGIVGRTLSTTPLFDLSCPAPSASSSTAAPSSTAGSDAGSSAGSSAGLSSAAGSAASASASQAMSSAANPTGTAVVAGGLSPVQGPGNGVVTSVAITATSSRPVASDVATIPSNRTGVTSAIAGNGSVATPRPSDSSLPTNGAVAQSGSIFGALGAMVAVIAAL